MVWAARRVCAVPAVVVVVVPVMHIYVCVYGARPEICKVQCLSHLTLAAQAPSPGVTRAIRCQVALQRPFADVTVEG